MKIWFVEPTSHHNNFGIMAEGTEKEIRRINNIAMRDFTAPFVDDPNRDEKKSWGAFHQGSTNDWTYWEFWADQTPEFRQKVMNKIEAVKYEVENTTEEEWL